MPVAVVPFLDELEAAAAQAGDAETRFREEAARRIAALEQDRAFAFRRLGLAREVTDVVASVEDEDTAILAAAALLRGKLGWHQDSEARAETLTRFAPVARAIFLGLPPHREPVPSVPEAFAAFETWYRESRGTPFWILFETYIPDTPLVDF